MAPRLSPKSLLKQNNYCHLNNNSTRPWQPWICDSDPLNPRPRSHSVLCSSGPYLLLYLPKKSRATHINLKYTHHFNHFLFPHMYYSSSTWHTTDLSRRIYSFKHSPSPVKPLKKPISYQIASTFPFSYSRFCFHTLYLSLYGINVERQCHH